MRIKVLHVPGCPNYQPAVERVEKVLLSESLRADIERVPVNSEAEAKTLRFPASPTIRVNGTDVSASLVAYTRMAAVFHQRQCFWWLYQGRRKGKAQ